MLSRRVFVVVARLPQDPAALTDYLLEHDPELVRLSRRIRRLQSNLKRLIGIEHFRTYLLLEEAANAHCLRLGDQLWEKGRAQGRRERRPRTRKGRRQITRTDSV